MQWRVLIVCVSIFITFSARANVLVVNALIDSNLSKHESIPRSPTIVRVIALHEVPQSGDLWKPVQSLSDFESVVDNHARASGVAFAIDELGNLATAAHVVEDSRCIWIVRADGSVLPAVVVGLDRRSDLAVIRTLDSTDPFELAPPNQIESANLKLRNGANPIFNSVDTKFIGNQRALPTLTRSSGRDYGNLIEFAGSAREGDSGSPLIDESGRAIGMLCAVIERADSPTSGFAIPFDPLNAERLRRLARGEEVQHGYAGVELANAINADQPVVRIETIAHDSPAGTVFQAGDEIRSINNMSMSSSHEVSRLIDASPDRTLSIEIVRAEEPLKVDLQVRSRIPQLNRIPTNEFVWSGRVYPIECFETVVTSRSIGEIEQAVRASDLIDVEHDTKSIEIWRAGEREQ